jgi:hypothetical protein
LGEVGFELAAVVGQHRRGSGEEKTDVARKEEVKAVITDIRRKMEIYGVTIADLEDGGRRSRPADKNVSRINGSKRLSTLQEKHIASCYPGVRDKMGDFLARGVKVIVHRQNETADDVPPYAIAVVDEPDFWIDCRETPEKAAEYARSLGLQVVEIREDLL